MELILAISIGILVFFLFRTTFGAQPVLRPKIDYSLSKKISEDRKKLRRLRRSDGSFYPLYYSGTPRQDETWVNYPLWVGMLQDSAASPKTSPINYDSSYTINKVDPYNSNSSGYSDSGYGDSGSSSDGGGGE